MTKEEINSLRVRYAPTMLYPPARSAFERALNAKVASVGKKNKVILADKGDHLEPVTTRRKTDND